ncbi:MAG: hypothetical protein ACM31G_00330 [Flavobacteriales bacterium]
MPHFLGDKLVVTKDELVPHLFPTYDALKVKLWRDEKKQGYGMKRAMYGGNCRKLLIEFDSLPKRIQERINDPRKPNHVLESFYKVDAAAVRYYNDEFTYPDGAYLLPETIENLIINASVLTAIVKLEEARTNERILKGGSTRGIAETLYKDAQSFNAILLAKYDCQHTLNNNFISFKRQLKAFKEDSYYAIIKDPEGKGRMNALKRDDKTNKLLNDLFAGRDHKPNPTEVADQYQAFLAGYIDVINNNTGEIYEPKDFKNIHPRTITAYLSTWESKIGTYSKRSGDRQKLMQDFVPYESMEKPLFAGSILSIDDRQPPFFYDKSTRMWWYLAIDVGSECITAWAYGKTKKELIDNFYKQLVINYHKWGICLPYEVECESSLNSSFKNTFLKNGAMFNKVNIHANSARSKRIERFFWNLRYGMEKEQIGWVARPFARNEANQASSENEVIIPYQKLVEQCLGNIVTWNNMPKKGTSISRFDFFMQNQHPELQPTNYKGFIQHLGNRTRTSCNAGIMNLQEKKWLLGDKGSIYSGDKLINLLKQVEGNDIQIFWMADNEGNVFKAMVYDVNDGRYICEALPMPKSSRAELEKEDHHDEARTILAKYRNTVTAYMQLQKNAIDKVTVIDNRPRTISNSFAIAGYKAFDINNVETSNSKVSPPPKFELDEIYDRYKFNPQNAIKDL